jgi:prefoldin subunit 5
VPGAMPREQELQMLRDHAEALKAQLDQISARIEELEKEG